MAADIQIHEMTGASAGTDKTSGTVRMKSADEVTVNTNNRLQVPSEGNTTYSYTKQLKFFFNTAPSIDIQNLRAYSDGANGFGTGVGLQYDVQASYGANVVTNISGTSIFTKTSVSTIDLDATNTGPHTSTGYKGDLLRIQMTVADTAGPGALSTETITFAYDET